MDVLMEMTWSDDIRRKGSRLAVPHFVSCLAWLWHPAQLAAGQWDGPGVKHCAVRTTSGRYLTVISQSGVLQAPSPLRERECDESEEPLPAFLGLGTWVPTALDLGDRVPRFNSCSLHFGPDCCRDPRKPSGPRRPGRRASI